VAARPPRGRQGERPAFAAAGVFADERAGDLLSAASETEEPWRGTRALIQTCSRLRDAVGITWPSAYADEILICEGDLIGKTRQQLRSLHFRRDRDWLQS
jgi:hypothetical protein